MKLNMSKTYKSIQLISALDIIKTGTLYFKFNCSFTHNVITLNFCFECNCRNKLLLFQ